MKNLITNNRYHIAEEEFYQARQFLADILSYFFFVKVRQRLN